MRYLQKEIADYTGHCDNTHRDPEQVEEGVILADDVPGLLVGVVIRRACIFIVGTLSIVILISDLLFALARVSSSVMVSLVPTLMLLLCLIHPLLSFILMFVEHHARASLGKASYEEGD